MSMQVFVTTEFEGFHHWPEAPEQVRFLRNVHRHLFKVAVFVDVSHDDRHVEFILLKRTLEDLIAETNAGDTKTWSCEQWARWIATRLPIVAGVDVVQVEVSEDGENGAIWQKDEHPAGDSILDGDRSGEPADHVAGS